MLKEFWESKKHLFQIVGSLTAIGALFLNIPQPTNQNAQIYLQNIQFFWLATISISILVLLINLLRSILSFSERKSDSELSKFNFVSCFIMGFVGISIFLLLNLWRYIFIIYSPSLKSSGGLLEASILIILFSLWIIVIKQLLIKRILPIFYIALIHSLVGCAFLTIMLYIVFPSLTFYWYFVTFVISLLLMFIMAIPLIFRPHRNTKMIKN